MSSYTRNQLEDWLKTIDVKADRVLDIGGSQLPIKGRTKSWDVKDYKILDLKNPHEQKVKPDWVGNIQDDLTDIDISESIEVPYFNVVFCLEVSEYWYNPLQALQNISELLIKGGILYISFHFLYPMHNPKGKDYLRYTKWGVEKLLKEIGFEIEDIKYRTVKDKGRLFEFYAGECMRPCKSYNQHSDIGYLIKAIKI